MTPRRLAAAGAVTAAAAWCAPAPAPVFPPLAAALGIPLRLPRGDAVALTFDDGPHPEGTPATLEALAQAGVAATFFLVGEQVERFPALAAEITAAGHEVALHGHRHVLLLRRTVRALADDLDRATDAVGAATGRAPLLYRPPYGVLSAGALALTRRRGLRLLLWSRWGADWRERETAAGIARRASTGLCGGDVVLLHDADHYSSPGSWRRTVAAVPAILDAVAAGGLSARSVTQAT